MSLRSPRAWLVWIAVLLCAAPIVGCAKSKRSSGGTAASARSLYTGRLAPVAFTPANALTIALNVAFPVRFALSPTTHGSDRPLLYVREERLLDAFVPLETTGPASTGFDSTRFDEYESCLDDGWIHYVGKAYRDGAAVWTATFGDCRENGWLYTGRILWDEISYYTGNGRTLRKKIGFDRYEYVQEGVGDPGIVVDGRVVLLENHDRAQSQTRVDALLVREAGTGRAVLIEDLREELREVPGEPPARWLTGRASSAEHGSVRFELIPIEDGHLGLRLNGAADTGLDVSLFDDADLYELDLDADDRVDGTLVWWSWIVFDPTLANVPPVAAIEFERVPGDDSVVVLDGLPSSDRNLDFITYRWKIADQPVGSHPLIVDPGARVADLVVDVPGTYTVSLTVSDGVLLSDPTELQIAFTGGAVAGADAGSGGAVEGVIDAATAARAAHDAWPSIELGGAAPHRILDWPERIADVPGQGLRPPTLRRLAPERSD